MAEDHVYREPAWISKPADKEAKADVLPTSERVGQIFALVAYVICVVFFVIHVTRPTGFFTDEFSTLGEALLYIMLALGLPPILVRLFLGRKNPARPFEVVGMAVAFVGQLYFLVVFPFDFTHFADPLPHSLEFLLDWIPEWLAKVVLVLGLIGSAVFSVYNSFLYCSVKKRLLKAEQPPAAEKTPETSG